MVQVVRDFFPSVIRSRGFGFGDLVAVRGLVKTVVVVVEVDGWW